MKESNGFVNSFSRGRGADVVLSAMLGLGLVALVDKGLCACTAFTGVSLVMATLSALLVGNRAFGSLTMEREKKTLDCLRLTQWSGQEVLSYKLAPELATLARILIVFAPSVLLMGWLSDAGLARAFSMIGLSGLAGLAAAVFGIFVSSLSETTSTAYVAGRCGKAVWLLLTPLLDRLLAAVLVSTKSWPVFTSLNPLVGAWSLALPESSTGLDAALPFISMLALPLVTLVMWLVACRRFENGLVASPSLTDRRVHPLYRQSIKWPRVFRANPALLRELALQLRSGAGRWPGYTVFFVLFLAPFLYAQSWTFKAQLDNDEHWAARRPVQVESQVASLPPTSPNGTVTRGISLRSNNNYNVRYVLKGHTPGTCLRMIAYQWWNVPLPAHELVKVVERSPEYSYYQQQRQGYRPVTHSTPIEQSLTSTEAAQIGAVGLNGGNSQSIRPNSQRPWSISRVALGMGLTGGITLLLIYLGIRCSGFLAAAVTGEKERCTWSDLILSGMSPVDLLTGKVGGSLLMPMFQMTVAYPSLLLFVAAGTVGLGGVIELYLYTVGLAAIYALLGLYCSVTSKTSHESHTKALAGVLLTFGVGTLSAKVPMMSAMLTTILVLAVLNGARKTSGRAILAAVWAVCICAMFPSVTSPLSATQGFLELPSLARNFSAQVPAGTGFSGWWMAITYLGCWGVLLWETIVSRLAHSQDGNALANDRAA